MKKVTDNDIMTALLCNGSPTAAARELGISHTTVIKRTRNPKFMAKFKECQDILLQSAVSTMKVRLSESLDTLSRIMKNPDAPYSVRVSAADSMLRHCRGYIETSEIAQRIKELEKASSEGEDEMEL